MKWDVISNGQKSECLELVHSWVITVEDGYHDPLYGSKWGAKKEGLREDLFVF